MELKLEQVSVHSRDLACRYVLVKAGETLSYSIKPQRNSIFFGIYLQSKARQLSSLAAQSNGRSTNAMQSNLSFDDRLRQAQLEPVTERRKLPGGKVYKGSLTVEQEGMYAIVFDNTFSKQKSKLVTFILQVYPTSCATPTKSDALVDDVDVEPKVVEEHLTGMLLKRRRKKLQGWARRWFVLDFESNTLNYYPNEHSTVLRGAIPLKVAVFSANSVTLEINIDSGAEIWQLKAQTEGSFALWKNALAHARESESEGRTHLAHDFLKTAKSSRPVQHEDVVDRNLWLRLQDVYGEYRLIGNKLSSLLQTAQQEHLHIAGEERKRQTSPNRSRASDTLSIDTQSLGGAKKNFWTKKRNSELPPISQSTEEYLANGQASKVGQTSLSQIQSDLSEALSRFDLILQEHNLQAQVTNGHSRKSAPLRLEAGMRIRSSIDSTRSTEDVWSDAVSVFEEAGFLVAHHDADSETVVDVIDDAASSDSDSSDDQLIFDSSTPLSPRNRTSTNDFPTDLAPLPSIGLKTVQRRLTIPKITDQPPSIIKLMSSKVGSDVSSMSAPAATNEPLGLLQKSAEELEYAELLTTACHSPLEDGSRILMVAAFAISCLSSTRHKERAKRKPFNPMLGETYELVREDKQFRFHAEKVQHRPTVGIACHAESQQWTFSQYQATTQKFYGKSMLLTTEGTTNIRLRTGDIYVWEKPEAYLKGIAFGEKFLEPCGEMVIRNIVTGETAIVKFVPTKGWVASRSEEVVVEAYDATGKRYEKKITGNWSSELAMGAQTVWKAGRLVENPQDHCGFTTFAAQLNEITEIEKDVLPPTDSRLRPDLRSREDGRLDESEMYKVRLEEGQRQRRTEMESSGSAHEPLFFTPSNDGKDWVPKSGAANYWNARQRGFTDVPNIFNL